MHEGPRPIFHRDIRWPNIVKRADDPTKWFLIDWDEAASPPTIAATHLDQCCHAPAVFLDDHGPEVDVWAVGMLLMESYRSLTIPSEFRVVGAILQSEKLTASEALERVKALKPLIEKPLTEERL